MIQVVRYHIRQWDALFENYKSREYDQCRFVCMPNKHGLGLSRVLSEPDGAAIFGIFVLIVEACSRQKRPRDGWLTVDGRPDGRPWSVSDLEIMFRRPAAEIERTLDVICDHAVDWADKVSGHYLTDTRTVSGREEKGIEENRNAQATPACSEPPNTATAEPPVATPEAMPWPWFPTAGRQRAWQLTDDCIADLGESFPGVDAPAECRKAFGWVKANLGRRKTARGMKKFLFGWMSRQQDRGGASVRPATAAASRVDVQRQRVAELRTKVGAK